MTHPVRLFFLVIWTLLVVLFRRLFRGPRHPAWTIRLEVLAEVMRGLSPRVVTFGFAEARRHLRDTPLAPVLARRVTVEAVETGGVPGERITPHGWTERDATVLFLHGGGYCYCSPGTHRDLATRVALAAGARCVVPDYRLAPEHPFPAALEDAVRVYRALLRDGVEPSRLIVAGDSAGGGLSVAALVSLRDEGEPLPAGAALMSPWVDLTLSGETIDRAARHDYVQRPAMEHIVPAYLGDAPATDPLVSPLHADLSGLPPLLVLTGEVEALRWEDEELCRRARAAGVEVELVVGDGMIHVWPAFAAVIPESRPAFRVIGSFITTKVGAS